MTRLRTLLLPPLLAAACAPSPPPAAAPAPVKRVRVVQTSDFHGRLEVQRPSWAGGRAVGGAAVLAAHLDSAAARFDGPTIVLSGGDDMQGTAVSNLSWGRAAIEALNAVGYDAAGLGNHEFDWGQDTLRARIRDSRHPWLAANLTVAGADTAPSWTRAWTMLERGGVRVAVIGVAHPLTPQLVMPGRLQGLAFGEPAPAIDRAAREARAAGADFVVVTGHVGARCATPRESPAPPQAESAGCEGLLMDVAAALTEPVDVVLGGHDHVRVLARSGGVPVAEAWSYSFAYSVTDLELRPGGRAEAVRREVRTAWADEVTPDTAVARVVEGWMRDTRPVLERAVATLAAPMPTAGEEQGESPVGNLLADAYRAAVPGAEAALVNNGTLRRGLPGGPVSYGTLYELQPFQNEMVVAEVPGAVLRAALEHAVATGRVDAHVAGLAVEWDPAAPAGARIRAVRRADGSPVRDTDTVRLALSEFVAQGGDAYTMFRGVPRRSGGVVDLDALIAHLRRSPAAVPLPAGGRWRPVAR